jgi:hypothetical protein
MPLIRGEAPGRSVCFAESTPAGWQALASDDRELWCARSGTHKLVFKTRQGLATGVRELYDLSIDPGERDDIYRPDHPAAVDLGAKLAAFIDRARYNRRDAEVS